MDMERLLNAHMELPFSVEEVLAQLETFLLDLSHSLKNQRKDGKLSAILNIMVIVTMMHAKSSQFAYTLLMKP
jgi:hypothetical protein